MNPRSCRPRLAVLRGAWLCLLLWLLTATRPANAAADPAPSYPWQESVWRLVADLRVDDALARLPARRQAGSDAERRLLDYTRAILLLDVQPRLPGNIDQARTLLESVRQARADDDTGLGALYYLARVAQFHVEPRDPARAAALYDELLARAPTLPLAQEALSRLAALRLYEDVSPDERRVRLEKFEAAADRLTLPAARRDAHFVLAAACMDLAGDRASALRHLLAAEAAGIVREQLAADTAVRIALLARSLGQRDVAIAHYKKFLAAYQRDSRAYMLGEQLKELETQAPPPVVSSPTPAPPPPVASADAPPAATPVPAGSPVSTPTPPAPKPGPPPVSSASPAPAETPTATPPPPPAP